MTLSGNNTYTGDTTVSAGTLELSGGSAIADTGHVQMADVAGATLHLNADETIGSLAGGGTTGGNVELDTFTLTTGDAGNDTFAGVISGTGGLTKQGDGTFTLSGANTYTGDTTVSAGTLELSGISAIADTGHVQMADVAGATLHLNANETIGSLAGGGSTGGNVELDSFTLTTGDAGNDTYGGAISGTGCSDQASATGILTLSGANTYTGDTTVSAGTLELSGGSAIADTGHVQMADVAGATLHLNANETIGSLAGGGSTGGNVELDSFTLTTGDAGNDTYGGVISGTGGLTKHGDRHPTLSGTNTYTGDTTVSAGTLELSGGSAIADTGHVQMADVAGATLHLNANETIGSLAGGGSTGGNVELDSFTLTTGDAGNDTYGGAISGTGALTKQGSGIFTLSGCQHPTLVLLR